METLEGYDRAIIIEALDSPDPVPGRIHHWDLEDLVQISPTQHSASAHDTSLPTAMETGRVMGLKLPDVISIYAIEVRCVDEFSEILTQEVGETIPEVVQQVLHEIGHDTVVQTQATAWR